MNIKHFELIDRCLFWKEKKILVVGDLHLGYEEVLMERGAVFPRTQMEETIGLFEKIFSKTGKVNKIILLGDVKHYFGGIVQGEQEDFLNLIELFRKNLLNKKGIVIIKGNHDNILEPIVRNYEDINLVDYYIEEEVLFFHGNSEMFKNIDVYNEKIKTIVIGHFHPAIIIEKDVKKEMYKCFLYGKWKKKEIIVVPSFFPLVEGKDVLSRRNPGYFEGKNIQNFEVWVLSGKFGEVFDFGKVKKLIKD
tara:strand:+ start:4606 stop:5352 length:747 start_codon:yes stop_codon:yes gene_type:complete